MPDYAITDLRQYLVTLSNDKLGFVVLQSYSLAQLYGSDAGNPYPHNNPMHEILSVTHSIAADLLIHRDQKGIVI